MARGRGSSTHPVPSFSAGHKAEAARVRARARAATYLSAGPPLHTRARARMRRIDPTLDAALDMYANVEQAERYIGGHVTLDEAAITSSARKGGARGVVERAERVARRLARAYGGPEPVRASACAPAPLRVHAQRGHASTRMAPPYATHASRWRDWERVPCRAPSAAASD